MFHFIEPLSLPLQERLQQIMTRPWAPTSWREFNAWNLAVHNELGHNASAVDTLAMLIPTLHQQPYAADIPWAGLCHAWATQFLQHTCPQDSINVHGHFIRNEMLGNCLRNFSQLPRLCPRNMQ